MVSETHAKTFDIIILGYPRERIIEEVMGRYIEVSPIQKVSCTTLNYTSSKESQTCNHMYCPQNSWQFSGI